MSALKCTTCGSTKLVQKDNIYECNSCGNKLDFSNKTGEIQMRLERAADHRQNGEFNKAKRIYDEIIYDYKDNPIAEAYYGAFLCEYTVLFETDFQTGKMYPSFYSVHKTPVAKNENLKRALETAVFYDKAVYYGMIRQSDDIEFAREKYHAIAADTPPWDVFICFKKTAYDGQTTYDYSLAQKLYAKLCTKFRIFYSDVSLDDNLARREYEPNIYYGLYTAKAMILICSDKDYLDSQWVKNEWSRFLALKPDGLIPLFTKDCDIYSMPPKISRLQGFKEKEEDYFIKLHDTLTGIVFSKERKEEEKRRAEEARLAAIRKEEELKNSLLEEIRKNAVVSSGVNVTGMIERIKIELKNNDYEKAQEICDKALNYDPKNSEVWWLLFLAKKEISDLSKIKELYHYKWPEAKEVRTALEFADAKQKAYYGKFIGEWIDECVQEAVKLYRTNNQTEAQKKLNFVAQFVDEFGGTGGFDFYYTNLMMELNLKKEEEITGEIGLSNLPNYIGAKKFANEVQKLKLDKLYETAKNNSEKFYEKIAQKNEVIKQNLGELALDIEEKVDKKNQQIKALDAEIEKANEIISQMSGGFNKSGEGITKEINQKKKALEDWEKFCDDEMEKQRSKMTWISIAVGFGFLTLIILILLIAGINSIVAAFIPAMIPLAMLLHLTNKMPLKKPIGGPFIIYILLLPFALLFYALKLLGLPQYIVYNKKAFDKRIEEKTKSLKREVRRAERKEKESGDKHSQNTESVKNEINKKREDQNKLTLDIEKIKMKEKELRISIPKIELSDKVYKISELEDFLGSFDEHIGLIKYTRKEISKM